MRSLPRVKKCSTTAGSGRTSPDRCRSVSDNDYLLANSPAFTHNSLIGAWGILRGFLGGFMFAIRSSNFQLSLMLATTLAFSLSALMWPVPGRAYTAEEQQAC